VGLAIVYRSAASMLPIGQFSVASLCLFKSWPAVRGAMVVADDVRQVGSRSLVELGGIENPEEGGGSFAPLPLTRIQGRFRRAHHSPEGFS
jgi:hypothetical protein